VISLRPYQATLADAVRLAFREGKRAPLVVLPTGGGKTTIFSYVTDNASRKGRCVYLLAHRAELVKQIAMTLSNFDCRHRIIAPQAIIRQVQVAQFKAHGQAYVDPTSRVLVASVQTLVNRLEAGLPDPDIIVIDEAHHLTMESTWGRCVAAFPNAKLLPVTATPCRLDGTGLGVGVGGFADGLIMGPTMRELIDGSFLSPYRIFAPPMVLDLKGVRSRAGDFAKDDLAAAVDKPAITGDAVEHYQRLASGKRAIAFCVSVGHAEHVAEEFRNAGVPAEQLDGTMDPGERERVIKRFEVGETLVLTSCDIVSEGFDLPAIEVAILLRPTKSLALYLQQVGRALRIFPGKVEALIIDHVGNVGRWDGGEFVLNHGLPDQDREWTLEGRKKRRGAADEEPEVDISTCPKCRCIQPPTKKCKGTLPDGSPCDHVFAAAGAGNARQIEQQAGELVEVQADQLEIMRQQQRRQQGKAKTMAELKALGMGTGRAAKILAAREAKADLVDTVVDELTRLRDEFEVGIFSTFQTTIGNVRKMKPKELRDLHGKTSAMLAQCAAPKVLTA